MLRSYFDLIKNNQFTGNLVSKKTEESVELQDQMQHFKNSMVDQLQEISSREQVWITYRYSFAGWEVRIVKIVNKVLKMLPVGQGEHFQV